ncbi:MAG TPA: carboxypeptidase-like regulatory domain-containing protein [Solirubrobacterales bacterium]|jgi:hypothetical protein
MLAAVGASCVPAAADAGQYTVWSCRGPEGLPISTAAWRTQVNDAEPGDIEISDGCASGGSLGIKVTDGGIAPDRKPRGEAVFRLPRGAEISGFKIWRYVVAAADFPGSEYEYAAAVREVSGGSTIDWGCASGLFPPYFNCSSEGTPGAPLDPSNLVTQLFSPLEGLSFWAACIQVGCKPPLSPPSAEIRMFRSAVSIEDDQPPEVVRLEGSLAESAPITAAAGHLFVTADDGGGGVAGFEFSVDGGAPQRVAVADGRDGCEEPFSEPDPCPREATRGIVVDTASLAAGAHSVSGTVIDAAGNATPFGPVAFTVAPPPATVTSPPVEGPRGNGGRRPDNGTPAVEAPHLHLQSTHAGGPGHLGGTLTTPAGAPIAGARLGVEVTEVGGKGARKRFVRTDANGRFAFKVAGAGARNVVVSYAPVLGGAASRSAKALVTTKLALRLTPRPRRLRAGQTVRFLGHLRGAGKAARGAVVDIQAIAGGRWTTIDTVVADGHGNFSWAHRFRYVERDAIFSFRAVVPRTPGWPWPTVRSHRFELPIEGPPR